MELRQRRPSYEYKSSFWPPAGIMIIMMVIVVRARNYDYNQSYWRHRSYEYKSSFWPPAGIMIIMIIMIIMMMIVVHARNYNYN